MGFVMGFLIGFVVGVLPQTRALVYAAYAKGKALFKRKGWIK